MKKMVFEEELSKISKKYDARQKLDVNFCAKIWEDLDKLGERYPTQINALLNDALVFNKKPETITDKFWKELVDFFENVTVSEGYVWYDSPEDASKAVLEESIKEPGESHFPVEGRIVIDEHGSLHHWLFVTDNLNSRVMEHRLRVEPSFMIAEHSPDGFNWGYGGAGPAQSAIAILQWYYGDDFAKQHAHAFKLCVISQLEQDKNFKILVKMKEREGENVDFAFEHVNPRVYMPTSYTNDNCGNEQTVCNWCVNKILKGVYLCKEHGVSIKCKLGFCILCVSSCPNFMRD